MSDDVVRRYNGARPIQAPAQLLADAIHEIEVLREENARLIRENKVAFEAVGGVVKANDKLKEENTRLREVLKPFVKTLELNCTEAYPDDFFIDQEGALRVSDLRAARAAIGEKGKG